MIDIKLLSQKEYTFAEIASIVNLAHDTVKQDFKRRKFHSVLKRKRIVTHLGCTTATVMKPVRVVSKATFIKYLAYLRVKRPQKAHW